MRRPFLSAGFLLLLAGCAQAPSPASPTGTVQPSLPAPSASSTATASATPEPPELRFAVIGDYGLGGIAEADVAALVHSWEPEFILTVGDNNYPDGSAATIDDHVGQYYHDFLYPYSGRWGVGAAELRFFPTLGNHDWYTDAAGPYLDYFQLPGNERYYDFTRGPVHFFALDSFEDEPDGVGRTSAQAEWLRSALAASTSPWQVVYFHYAPYSSADHGSIEWMRWPFAAWGAELVLTGHAHAYERLEVDGIPYIVNGPGGGGLYNFGEALPETRFRYNANTGALFITASPSEMRIEFTSREGNLVDAILLTRP